MTRIFAADSVSWAAISILALLFPAACYPGERRRLSDDEIRARVETFARRMGFDWARYVLSGKKWRVNAPDYDWYYRLSIASAGGFAVDVHSGAILSVSHCRGSRPGKQRFGTLPEDQTLPRPPRMTKQQVIARARAFFERLDPAILQDAELHVVQYNDERCNPRNYSWWRVRWKPSFHGHPCVQDFYQVTWYDEDDQFSGFIRTIARTPPRPVVKVKPEKARKLASAKRIWSGLETRYRVKDARPARAEPELFWVRPYPILEAQPFLLPRKPPAKFIALAWVVKFRATINGIEDEVQVWIDAEDGEFLGANFVAH